MTANRRRKSSSSGNVLVEIVIVLPFLLGIPMMVIELARYLRFMQIANVISQEAAIRSYRACADITAFELTGGDETETQFNKEKVKTRTGECLQTQTNNFQAAMATRLPAGARIVLSVYRFRLDPTKQPDFEQVASRGDNTSPGNKLTKYEAAGFKLQRTNAAGKKETMISTSEVKGSGSGTSGQDAAGIATGRQRFVVAEVIYEYTPILNLIPLLRMPTDGLKTTQRETTIL